MPASLDIINVEILELKSLARELTQLVQFLVDRHAHEGLDIPTFDALVAAATLVPMKTPSDLRPLKGAPSSSSPERR